MAESKVELILTADNKQAVAGIKETQKAADDLNKVVEKGTQRQKGLIEDIEGELNNLEKARKKAFTVEDIEKYNKKIAEGKRDLQEYEQAGIKAEKATATLSQTIGKWALGLGGAAAASKLLLGAVKELTVGINAFNIIGAVTKQVLNDIVTGVGLSIASIKNAIEVQKKLNELRMEEYKETYMASKAMNEYYKLYTKAIDQTKTRAERLELVNAAMAKHNEAIDIQIKHTKDLAIETEKSFKKQPTEKVFATYAGLMTKLENLDAQRESQTRRLQSLKTGLEKDELDERANNWQKYYAEIEKTNEDADKAAEKARDDEIKETVQAHVHVMDQIRQKEKEDAARRKEEKKKETTGIWDMIIAKTIIAQENIGKAIEESDKKITANKKREEDKRRDAMKESWGLIIDGERAIFDLISANLNAKYDMEMTALDKSTQDQLKAVGDNESKKQRILEESEYKKSQIERKYKREQQKLDIKQAIANAALSILETFKKFGWPWGIIPAALMAGIAALQISTIKAQVYAKGGWTGDGEMKDQTGERVAGIVHEKEFVVRRGPAEKYKGILEAINRDNKKDILSSLNMNLMKSIPESSNSNNVTVNNDGSNSRLDKVIAEQKKLNNQFGKDQILITGHKKVVTKGKNIRIVG